MAHSEPLLWQLHWLPVQSRIRSKDCLHYIQSPFCTNSQTSPQYHASLIHHHQPVRSLRSSDQRYLLPTPFNTNVGSHSFRCSAPAICNAIPLEIRSLQTIDAFKRNLNTHYSCFPWHLPRSSSPRASVQLILTFARKHQFKFIPKWSKYIVNARSMV